jgi:hypothetical protein
VNCSGTKVRNAVQIILSAAFFLAAASAAGAGPQSYNCKITPTEGSGWVPREAIYKIDEDEGTADVFDPVIKSIQETPMQARLTKKGAKMIQLRWKVKGLTSNRAYWNDAGLRMEWQSKTSASYIVQLDSETGQMSLRGIIPGAGRVRAVGACTIKR